MILVTGAGGFIGRRLVSQFISRGIEVISLYRSKQANIQDGSWEADLTRPDHISALKEARSIPKTVVHLAGHIEIALQPNRDEHLALPVPGKENIGQIYASNVMATANLLDFCLHVGVGHLVFASSQTVYGMPGTEIITEESPCAPLEHYAASKVCCEKLLQIGVRQGIAVTVLRLPGIYSEERRDGVVYGFCKSALQKRKINVRADFPLPIDVIHIDDVIGAIEKTIYFGGLQWNCLNISTGEACSLNILADSIAELIPGCEVNFSGVTQPIVCMDSSKAHSALGWRAVSRRERLSTMIKNSQD